MSQSAHPMLGARQYQMFPTMTQADNDRLHRFGESKFYEAGERIVRAGHVAPGLIVILSLARAPRGWLPPCTLPQKAWRSLCSIAAPSADRQALLRALKTILDSQPVFRKWL